jgi:tetratricopeptide (TPR) repeat protein
MKANVLYVVPLLVAVLYVPKPIDMRKTTIAAMALVAGTLLAISPATIHNYRATGALIPINYSGGVTVYIGNWEMADGSFMVPEYFSLDPVYEEKSWHALAEALSGRSLNANETSSYWLREGLREAIANPGHTIAVTLKKMYLLIAGIEIADNYPVSFGEIHFPPLAFFIPFWFVALFGLAGMVAYVRREHRHELHLYAFLIGFSGLIVISKVAERYRLALATVLALFAGYALYRLWCIWSERKRRAEAIAYTTLLMLGALFLIVVRPLIVSTEHADVYLSFGSQYLDEEDTAHAKEMFEAGIALSPLHEPLLQQYGKAQLLEGSIPEALETYRDALRARSDASSKGLSIAFECMEGGCTYESVRAEFDTLEENKNDWSYQKEYLEGMRAFRRGDSDTAIELFNKAYELNPKIRGLKSNIALLYGKEGNDTDAQKYLLEAVVENSFDIVALYNLGNAYSRAGDYKQALPYYARVQELVPDFNLARYNLARSYMNTGESWKAREEFEAFIAYAEEQGLYSKEIERSRQAMSQIENTLMQGLLPSMNTPEKTVVP